MNAEHNPHARFGFEHAFLFDGTWQIKGDATSPYMTLIVAYINTFGFVLHQQGISPRQLRVPPFPDFSYRVVPTRNVVFLLLGESSSRTARYALYEDRLDATELGKEALLKECEDVLGWEHCLAVQFPFSALINRDRLNEAAEQAARETVEHLQGVMHRSQVSTPAKESHVVEMFLALVTDGELRQHCQDLLAAEKHYDRVIREACVILEDRVRQAIGADHHLIGTALMEQAFNPKSGMLRLSPYEAEQRGGMYLYSGIMAFFRNAAGHHIAHDTYTQHDALRFVLWINVLPTLVRTASSAKEEARFLSQT